MNFLLYYFYGISESRRRCLKLQRCRLGMEDRKLKGTPSMRLVTKVLGLWLLCFHHISFVFF